MLALGVCFPQPCLSAGRRFAASRSRLYYYGLIDQVDYFVKWNLSLTKNLRIAKASEKAFARFSGHFFGCSSLSRISVFGWTRCEI